MNKFNIILLAVLLSALNSCVDVSDIETPSAPQNLVADWRDEVIYQLMTDRFADGDVNNNNKVNKQSLTAWNGGDFQGIIDNIDYLKALGVTTLWISPVVKNVEEDAGIAGYHGYWTQDFTGVNPHFGDMAKLREMVDVLHENNIKVILDIVANHIGQLFYYDMNKNDQPDEMVMGSNMTCGQYCGHITGIENEAAGSQICEEEYSSEFTLGGDNSECYYNCVNRCETEDYPQKIGLKRYSEWDPDFDARGIMAFSEAGESGPAPLKWVYMPEINRVPPNPAEFYNDDWYNKLGRIVTWDSNYQVVKGDFPGGLKDLDTTRSDVTAALISAYEFWIENVDFDGFRIDTIKHVEHEFWQKFTPAMRAKAKAKGKDNFFIFGEAFDGNDELLGSFTKNGEMDSVFYFSQKFQVYDAIFKYGSQTKNFENLFNARKDLYGTVSGVSDADGKNLSPQGVLVNFFDNHDLPRFLYEKNDEKSLRAALGLLLTQDGIPCIYYGTEQNFSGGNDPANREFLATSGYDTKNATFKWISSLTSIRKKYSPLRRGDMSIVWSTDHTGEESDAGILAFERKYKGETVLVIINAKAKTSSTAFEDSVMQTTFEEGTKLKDVSPDGGSKTFTVGNGGELDIEIPAQSMKILVKK